MANVKIDRKPDMKPSGLYITRKSGRTFQIGWNIQDWTKSGKNRARAERTQLLITFVVRDSGQKKDREIHKTVAYLNLKTTSMTINLNNFTVDDGVGDAHWSKKGMTRSDFYPFTFKRNNKTVNCPTLKSIKVQARFGNGNWNNTKSRRWGAWSSKTYSFANPRKPSIGAWSQNPDTGIVTTRITTNAGEDKCERYDTQYYVKVYNSNTRNTAEETKSSTSTDFNIFKDAAGRMGLGYDNYIMFYVKAKARGYTGDSDWEEKYFYVAWPLKPNIGSPTCSSTNPDGKITVAVNLKPSTDGKSSTWNENHKKQHPVDGCRLEMLPNVSYTKESQIPGDAAWVETGAVDNGSCAALSTTVAEAMPDRGNNTWLRVKSWNDVESIFYRYSTPKRIKDLYQSPQTGADDEIEIVQYRSGDDGKTVYLRLGWDVDDATGTEVTWSDNENAWKSTTEPNSYEFTRNDGKKTIDGTVYNRTAELYVAGLSEGVPYFFRARRYTDPESGDRLYGPYSSTVTVMPTSSPESVVLSAPTFVQRGASLPVSWTFDSEAPQTKWQLITGPVTETTETVIIDGVEVEKSIYRITERRCSVIHEGTDGLGSRTIEAERLSSLVGSLSYVWLAVRVSTGGDMVTSDAIQVNVADPPVLYLTANNVTAMPVTVGLGTSVPEASVSMTLNATGITGEMPYGSDPQLDGDTIWSNAFFPTWQKTTLGASALYDELVVPARQAMLDAQAALDGALQTVAMQDPWETLSWVTPEDEELDEAKVVLPLSSLELDTVPLSCVISLSDGSETVATYEDYYQSDENGDMADDGEYIAYNTSGEQPQAVSATIEFSTVDVQDLSDAYDEARLQYEELSERYSEEAVFYTYDLALPDGIDLRDGGTYEMTAVVTDAATNLRSNVETAIISVAWAHQAPSPNDDIEIVPYDEVDENGFRRRGCRIPLAKPHYNITPFFSRSFDDSGYWYDNTYLNVYATQMTDGWAHFDMPSNKGIDVSPLLSAIDLKPSTRYTVLLDTRDVEVSGAVILYGWWSDTSAWASGNMQEITEDGCRMFMTTKPKSAFDAGDLTHARLTITSVSGTLAGDIRLSLYEGETENEYMSPSTREQEAGDRYDLYRVTADGPSLVRRGLDVDAVVEDNYAAFGNAELAYRIASRTTDGDTRWTDVPYEFGQRAVTEGNELRIDFGDEYIEFERGVSLSDSIKKDFEQRTHYGERVGKGYWGESVTRTVNGRTVLIRLYETEQIEKLRQLSRFMGPVYVRASNGTAYPANVQVSTIAEDVKTAGATVSLDITEILDDEGYLGEVVE